MMYLPCITEWFFERRDDGMYDVVVDDRATTCPAYYIHLAFYVLAGYDYDPYDED